MHGDMILKRYNQRVTVIFDHRSYRSSRLHRTAATFLLSRRGSLDRDENENEKLDSCAEGRSRHSTKDDQDFGERNKKNISTRTGKETSTMVCVCGWVRVSPSRLQLAAAAAAIHDVPEGRQEVVGLQRRSGDLRVGVFRFAVLPEDDDPARLEALTDEVALDVLIFQALADGLRALPELEGIEEGLPAHAVGDLAVSEGGVEIEVLVAIEGKGEVVLLEDSQSLVVLLNEYRKEEKKTNVVIVVRTNPKFFEWNHAFSIAYLPR